MSPDPILVRQQPIQSLGRFSLALAEALNQSTSAPDKFRGAVLTAFSGECIQCGIRVSGEELLTLCEPAEADETNPRVARLKQGYCARNGCNSYYYRLIFTGHPDIDWTRVLSQTEPQEAEHVKQADAECAAVEAAKRAVRRRMAGRVLVGVAVVALLLLIRQWFVGGTIPLVREPENFQVDPVPPGKLLQ